MTVEQPTCGYCGRPFNAKDEQRPVVKPFCGSGCAMAARLGIQGAQFPVTPQLVFDVVFGLGVFNELLLVPLAMVLHNGGNEGGAALCVAISGVLGVTLYLAALAWQWRIRWVRAGDAVLYALLAAPVLGGAGVALYLKSGGAALIAAVANLALAVWLARGFLRRVRARRSRG